MVVGSVARAASICFCFMAAMSESPAPTEETVTSLRE